MLQSGRVVFGQMEEVVFGAASRRGACGAGATARRPAGLPDGERHAQPQDRRDREGAARARQPLRRHLRPDAAAYAARRRDRGGRAGARGRRRPDRHHRRRLVTDGAKAVQLCLANDIRTPEAMDDYRPVKGPTARWDHLRARRPRCGRSRCRPRSRPASSAPSPASPTSGAGEGAVPASAHHPARRDARPRRHACTRPTWLWLSTGIRAVDHCVEGICSGEANPFADAQALHGLTLLARGLPRVKADPKDLQARLDCQIGPGCRWDRWRAACRWAPATASAMCWARCSTSRTAILRASCCPR